MNLPAHGCRELLGRRKETAVRHPPALAGGAEHDAADPPGPDHLSHQGRFLAGTQIPHRHVCTAITDEDQARSLLHPPPGQSRMALGGPMYHENGMDSRGASARKRRYTLVQTRTVTSPSSLTRYFAALTLVFLWRAGARRPLTSRGPSEMVALIDGDPARPRRKPRSSRCRPRGGS